MDDLALRLLLLVNIVVPLLFFMAWIYLGLHMLFARVIGRSDSPVLWFFSVVTGPLIRPVRALVGPGAPEPRVRAIAFVMYIGLWLVTRVLFAQLIGARPT
jgi:hypothetical protein